MSESAPDHIPYRADSIIPATNGHEFLEAHQRPTSGEPELTPKALAAVDGLRGLLLPELPERATVDPELHASVDPYLPTHLGTREIPPTL